MYWKSLCGPRTKVLTTLEDEIILPGQQKRLGVSNPSRVSLSPLHKQSPSCGEHCPLRGYQIHCFCFKTSAYIDSSSRNVLPPPNS